MSRFFNIVLAFTCLTTAMSVKASEYIYLFGRPIGVLDIDSGQCGDLSFGTISVFRVQASSESVAKDVVIYACSHYGVNPYIAYPVENDTSETWRDRDYVMAVKIINGLYVADDILMAERWPGGINYVCYERNSSRSSIYGDLEYERLGKLREHLSEEPLVDFQDVSCTRLEEGDVIQYGMPVSSLLRRINVE